jgi:UDP-N-acetyl-2-amino-2-deoxyglucuronate dehydrogenase
VTDPTPVGFGLVGCGGISGTHASALARVPGARLVAVCDRDAARAQALGTTLGVPWHDDLAALLARPDVEAVTICAPSGLHGEIGIAAARAGKHVIVEKPVETTLEKIDALVAACRQAGVRLSVISQYRFHGGMRGIHDAARAGRFGRLTLGIASTKWYRGPEYFASAPWRGTVRLDGGGCLMNQGLHAVDLLLAVFGRPVRVRGYATTRCHRIETEDAAAGVIEFEGGAIGVLEASTAAYPGVPAKIEIMGDAGSAIWELGASEYRLWECADGTPAPAIEVLPWEAFHGLQFADFVGAIRSEREPAVTAADGRRAVETILALYRSSAEGRAVELT